MTKLSVRAQGVLRRAGYNVSEIKDTAAKVQAALASGIHFRNCGPKTVQELQAWADAVLSDGRDRLCENDNTEIPRLHVRAVATDYSDFWVKLNKGDLPLPCWLDVGDAAHKITHDNHRELARGMLLQLEVKGVLG